MGRKIITITHQFGSRSHEVAQRLSDQPRIPLYDRNLAEVAVERMGYSPVSIEKIDESTLPSSLASYQTPKEPSSATGYGLPPDNGTHVTQTIIMEALTRKGPCVIIGRCGDYMLRNHPDLIGVSIYADMEDRVHRIMDRCSFSGRDAVNVIKSTNCRRRNYYKNYTKRKWGSIEPHRILLNISKPGIDKTARIIKGIYETP